MKNKNKEILVSILTEAMLLTAAAVSAASFARSGSGSVSGQNQIAQMTAT